MDIKISIDKISFTAKMDTIMHTKINEFLSTGYIEHEYFYSPRNFMYQHNFNFPDGSFFQHGTSVKDSDENVRLEFNPNNCDWKLIYQIIKRLKYPKITRLDYAVDYKGYDFSDWEFESLNARKLEMIYSRSKKLETYYLGSRKSDKFIRIYDKAKETNKNKRKEEEEEIQTAENWWRIESVIKDFAVEEEKELKTIDSNGEAVIKKKKVKVDKGLVMNPFPMLLKKRKEIATDGMKMQEKAMLFYLQHNPSEWSNLSANSRKKYEKMVFSVGYEVEEELQPSYIWEKEKDRLLTEIKEWLQPAIDNGNYLTGISLAHI